MVYRSVFICRDLKMSAENRKRMYDQLVAAGRFADIDQYLIKEFGDPRPKEEPEVMGEVPKPVPIKEPVKQAVQPMHKKGRKK